MQHTYAFSHSQSLNSALSSISYKRTLWIIMLIYKMTIWINHMLNYIYFKISFKQKAHWATSPEKPVQINKHV